MINFSGAVSSKILAYPAVTPTKLSSNLRVSDSIRANDQIAWAAERIAEYLAPGAKLTTAKLQVTINRFIGAAIKRKFKLKFNTDKLRRKAEDFKRNAESIRIGARLDVGKVGNIKDARRALLELERRFESDEELAWEQFAVKKETKYDWKLKFYKNMAANYGLFGAAQRMGSKSIMTNFAWFLATVTMGTVAVETIDKAVAKTHIALTQLKERIQGIETQTKASFEDMAAKAIESGEIDESGMANWLSTLGGDDKGGKGKGSSWIGRKLKGGGRWISSHAGKLLGGLTVYGLYSSLKSAMVEIIAVQGELASKAAGSGARWQDFHKRSKTIGRLVNNMGEGRRLVMSMADYGSVALEASQSIMVPLAKSAKLGLDLTRDSAVQESIAAFAHSAKDNAINVWGDITYRLYDIKSAPLRRKALNIIATQGTLFAAHSDTWFMAFAKSVTDASRRLEKSGMRLGAAERTLRDLASVSPYSTESKWKGTIERYGGTSASTQVALGDFGVGLDQMEKFARDNKELLSDPLGVKLFMAKWEMDSEQVETLQALLKGDREGASVLLKDQKMTEKEKLDQFFDQRVGTDKQTWTSIGIEWKELFIEIAQELIEPMTSLANSLLETIKEADMKSYIAATKSLASLAIWAIRNFSEGATLVGQLLIHKMKLHGSRKIMLAQLDEIKQARGAAEQIAKNDLIAAETRRLDAIGESTTTPTTEFDTAERQTALEALRAQRFEGRFAGDEGAAHETLLPLKNASVSAPMGQENMGFKGNEKAIRLALSPLKKVPIDKTQSFKEPIDLKELQILEYVPTSQENLGLEDEKDLQVVAGMYLTPAEMNTIAFTEGGIDRAMTLMDQKRSVMAGSSSRAIGGMALSVVIYNSSLQVSIREGMTEGFIPISDGTFQKSVTNSANASLREAQGLFNGSVWEIGAEAMKKVKEGFEEYKKDFSLGMDNLIEKVKEFRKTWSPPTIDGFTGALMNGLGALSRRFESNGNPGAVGFDPPGGTSYGMYQIATRTGTMKEFMNFLASAKPDWYERLRQAGNPDPPEKGRGLFAQVWRVLSVEAPQLFAQIQHAFIKATIYDRAAKRLQGKGVDESKFSGAMREILWSTATGHGAGGASKIFSRAFAGGGSEVDIISRIYAIRKTQYGSQPANIQKALVNRYVIEEQMALQMLGQNYVAPAELPSVGTPGYEGAKNSEISEASMVAIAGVRHTAILNRRQRKAAYYEMIAEYAGGWLGNTEQATHSWKNRMDEERYQDLRDHVDEDVYKILDRQTA